MGQKSSLNTAIVVIGRIGAPFGVRGQFHIQSFTSPSNNILSYKTWYFKLQDNWQKVPVLKIQARSTGFIGGLKGIETREAAACLTHADIGIARSDLPALAEGEYYWADLIGLTVVTEKGEALGQVHSLLETGANDVLVVKGQTREYLIPYLIDDTVLKVDLASHTVNVSWDPEF